MISAAYHRFELEDYLRLEETSGVKHEFLDGRVVAMSGRSPEHAAVTAAITRLLGNALDGKPCRVYSPDLRICVQATGLWTYPDVSVICGAIELDPTDRLKHTAVNPRVLVEILSPSTEDYDRGEKLGHYKRIPSVAEVMLVAYDRREIEIVRREPDGSWSRHIAREGDVALLTSLGCGLPVANIYRDPLAG